MSGHCWLACQIHYLRNYLKIDVTYLWTYPCRVPCFDWSVQIWLASCQACADNNPNSMERQESTRVDQCHIYLQIFINDIHLQFHQQHL